MLLEERVHVRLVELVVTASDTVPENTLTGAMVIVDVPCTLTLVGTVVGLAEIVKSVKLKVAVAV